MSLVVVLSGVTSGGFCTIWYLDSVTVSKRSLVNWTLARGSVAMMDSGTGRVVRGTRVVGYGHTVDHMHHPVVRVRAPSHH